MPYHDFAVNFWEAFKDLARECFPSRHNELRENTTWTNFMVKERETCFLTKIVNRLREKKGLDLKHTQTTYFGLDQTWYKPNDLNHNDWKKQLWSIEIAIEHENNQSTFMTEIWRLGQIIAGLKVGITYANKDERNKLLPMIQMFLKTRPTKPESDDYLIIFGPHYDQFYTLEWKAYHFDKNGNYSMIDQFKLEETRE